MKWLMITMMINNDDDNDIMTMKIIRTMERVVKIMMMIKLNDIR